MDKPFQVPTREEWKLGGDTEELHYEGEPYPQMPSDRSAARLDRPLQVVTVEHLAWLMIGAWALISRLAILGVRPLTAAEASSALSAYDLANRTTEASAAGFHPIWPSWISIAQAGLFAAFGAGDFTARALFAVFGLVLIAALFAIRPYVGRAGAIGAGAMLALSPSVTWFSRTAGGGIVAAALTLTTLALFMALKARPSAGRTSALGVAAGLMISADPMGLASGAILTGALAIAGLLALITTRHAYLHARVWLIRYGGLAATAILVAVAICILSVAVSGFSRDDLREALRFLWPLRSDHLEVALYLLIVPLGLYEFILVIAASGGLLAIITWRARSRFAWFVLIWAAVSLTFYVTTTTSQPEQMLVIILPAAILGGLAIEYLDHTRAWGVTRIALAILAILTIYVQSLTNFLYYAPDTTEARWNRHAGLYWSGGATTIRAKSECETALERIAQSNITVFHEDQWPPALRWYLRVALPVASVGAARLLVDTQPTKIAVPEDSAVSQFEYEESWSPRLVDLNWRRTLAYLLLQRPWGEMTSRSATLEIMSPSEAPAPTMILPPSSP